MKKILRSILIGAIVAMSVLTASDAYAVRIAVSHTDHEIKLLKEKAAHGDVSAQKTLAYAYFRGFDNGTFPNPTWHQDYKEAFKYFKQVADTGDAPSQAYIGWFHDKGKGGVSQNAKTALKWYRLAAAQKFPFAEDRIGQMYRDGRGGLPKNYSLAAAEFKKAALQFDGPAAYHLGTLYYKGGPGLPQNYEKAFFWMSLPGNPAWYRITGLCDELCADPVNYKSPNYYIEVQEHLTPEQIKKIRQQVIDYKMRPSTTKWLPAFIPVLPPAAHTRKFPPISKQAPSHKGGQ